MRTEYLQMLPDQCSDVSMFWSISLVVMQILGIAILVFLLSRMCFSNAKWKCRVVHAGIVAVLLVIPMQRTHRKFPYWGWRVTMDQAATANQDAPEPQPIRELRKNEPTMDLGNFEVNSSSHASNESQGDSSALFPQTQTSALPVEAAPDIASARDIVEVSEFDRTEQSKSEQSKTDFKHVGVSRGFHERLWSWRLLLICYLAVTTFLLLRLGVGIWAIHRLIRRAKPLSLASSLVASECQKWFAVSARIETVVSSEVSMPIAVGLLRPMVVVPSSFETWPTEQKRAVLVHEYAHTVRYDVFFELLARIMVALYWVHPGAIWLAMYLRRIREIATDGAVLATGVDPRVYAQCLMDVIESQTSTKNTYRLDGSAIAMSAFGDMETRIETILERKESKMSNLHGWCLLCVVFMFLLVSMVDLHAVDSPARDSAANSAGEVRSPASETPEVSASESSAEHDDLIVKPTADPRPAPTNDLLQAILRSSVERAPSTEYECEVIITGRVTDANSTPVPNAIVLLRNEFPLQSTSMGALERQRGYILAKVQADLAGNFAINATKVPMTTQKWLFGTANRFVGHLVVGIESAGINIVPLEFETSQTTNIRFERIADVELAKTKTIEGRCVSVEGVTEKNARVFAKSLSRFDLQRCSFSSEQIQIQDTSDEDGRFRFLNVPTNMLVSLSCDRSQHSQSFEVLTTCNKELHSQIAGMLVANGEENLIQEHLQLSPVTLRLGPPTRAHVRVVDERGSTLKGALLKTFEEEAYTDESGMAQVRVPFFRSKENSPSKTWIQTKLTEGDNVYWPSWTFVSTPSEISEVVEVTLESAVRVRGRFLSIDGEPVADVSIADPRTRNFTVSATSGADGRFDMVAKRAKGQVVVYSRNPGYLLPSDEQASMCPSEIPVGWKTIDLDTTQGKEVDLGDIIVEKTKSITIQARLPDGAYAKEASVILSDIEFHTRDERRFRLDPKEQVQTQGVSVRKGYLSSEVRTDKEGIAGIKPSRFASKLSAAEVRFMKDGVPYFANALLFSASNGRLEVQLRPGSVIRGTTMMNNKPIAGAVIVASIETPQTSEVTSDWHLRSWVTSDSDGRFDLILPSNRRFQVRVEFLPNGANAIGPRSASVDTRQMINDMSILSFDSGTQTIRGLVVDQTGAPYPGAVLSLQAKDQRRTFNREEKGYSGVDGRFVLRDLPREEYFVKPSGASRTGYHSSGESKAVKAGESEVRLMLRRDR